MFEYILKEMVQDFIFQKSKLGDEDLAIDTAVEIALENLKIYDNEELFETYQFALIDELDRLGLREDEIQEDKKVKDEIIKTMTELIEKYPEQRVGQLIYNTVCRFCANNDCFFVSNKDFLNYLKKSL